MERVRHAIAQISKTLSIDAYEFPNGEIRVGVTSASILLGYSKEYFSRLAERGKKKLKALQGEGLDGWQKPGEVERKQGGTAEVKTLSIQDLAIWVQYEAKSGNKTAFDLAIALSSETLEERIKYPFESRQKTIEEKIDGFDDRLARIAQETARSFTEEEWRETSSPGIELEPSAWAARFLSDRWQPTLFLEAKTDEEIEEWIQLKRVEYE